MDVRYIIFSALTICRPCLVPHPKKFHISYRMFRHIHRVLNIDKKTNYTVWLEIMRRIF